ncbi:probable phospholipid-transporting ATPase VD isoform X1 [Astyanax mexicanus]|uniref:probable phospholipid-transporting ATPase VD isoform X1 n=1 Tax=Astyanax mexicanus TaxID=7994 RepID=UPI0020CAF22E|nr:probable phospholipid-transporting ATPase VD isoform X1 [Astyanax mexicanus]
MERFHLFRNRWQQVSSTETRQDWTTPANSLPSKSDLDPQDHPGHKLSGKRRTVIARYGPYQAEYHNISKGYQGNGIRTTKYTLLSFIPMNLFQQFHRAANLYFLFLVLLNWVPVVEAFQKEITMIPLAVVLIVIAFKDAMEDYRRYRYDQRINNTLTHVYSGKQRRYVERRWAEVCVGDVVRLCCNEIIPADMVLLHSSDTNGVCHIETANLDGETNLKQRQVVRNLPQQGSEFTPENFSSRIECENPNDDLRRFRGYMEHPNKVKVGLHSENLLLRSCIVRNTETVIGIVVYAGHETKAMQNNSGPRYKRSKLERRLNVDVLWSVVILLLMCLTAAIGHGLWLNSFEDHPVFLIPDDTHPALAGFYMFWTMIIVLQVLIPVSLYVSIEIVKLGQIYFIQNDLDLYNPKLDSGVQCRALNITEDLGQIQYLFSDKTGTLTENRMLFRRCTVSGTEYPHHENARAMEQFEEQCSGQVENTLTLRSRSSRKSLSCNRSSVSLNTLAAESDIHSPHDTLRRHAAGAFSGTMECAVVPDVQLQEKLRALSAPLCPPIRHDAEELSHILDFFLALTVCNTVVVSSPSQPRHVVQIPMARTPLRSLEDIKAVLQKLSLPRFSLSPSQNTDSPPSLTRRLFSRGRAATYAPNTPNTQKHPSPLVTPIDTPAHTPSPSSTPTLVHSGACGNDGERLQPQLRVELEDEDSANEDVGDDEDGDEEEEEELLYEAESPDEAALVQAARAYGCTLLGRSPEQLLVALPGTGPLSVPLLHLLPFHSARKRMSVVVRHPLTGQVVVYTKGADNVIMELAGTSAADGCSREIMEKTQQHLDNYAREGLRTLCVAKRVLDEAEYEAWLKRHAFAETSIENREQLLLESAQRLETNLTLLGATGIVDRLQEEVPETIEALQRAGIKVWVLTGDKQETAVNIACACKLLRPTDQLLTANCDSKEACEARLYELQRDISTSIERGLPDRSAVTSEDQAAVSGFTLVIDGRTLDFALEEDLQKLFLDLTGNCRSVICCRSTPLQKSQVVRLVGDSLGVMSLAIGDGANDVSMIQVADVGVGISGQEGMQAVMSSDFAISRFKHLRKLLLVHGHWCYTRLANMILYFFYKNVMYVNLLFWFQFFCGYSGSTMTNSWVLIFFNLLFTSVPPLLYGVLDKDVSANTLLSLPQLYKAGQNSQAYLPCTFWLTMLDAFYQSLVCFFIPYFAYADSDIGLFSFGSPINGSALLIILLHQVIESRTLTWIHAVVFLGSAAFYYTFVLVFSLTCVTCNPPTNPYGVETRAMSHPSYYFVCGLTTILALLPRLLCRALCNSICPSDLVKAQKLDKSVLEQYWATIHQWKESKPTRQRQTSTQNPQSLSVNADVPNSVDCNLEAGAVVS